MNTTKITPSAFYVSFAQIVKITDKTTQKKKSFIGLTLTTSERKTITIGRTLNQFIVDLEQSNYDSVALQEVKKLTDKDLSLLEDDELKIIYACFRAIVNKLLAARINIENCIIDDAARTRIKLEGFLYFSVNSQAYCLPKA